LYFNHTAKKLLGSGQPVIDSPVPVALLVKVSDCARAQVREVMAKLLQLIFVQDLGFLATGTPRRLALCSPMEWAALVYGLFFRIKPDIELRLLTGL